MNAMNASLPQRDVPVLYAKCPKSDPGEHWILLDSDTKPNSAVQCLSCGPKGSPTVIVIIDQPWKKGLVSLDEADSGYTQTKPYPDDGRFPRQTAI